MPRVTHVKAARADVKGSDIKKGESYYWWKFRYGGKHVSRTPPKASQLTQSAFLSGLYSVQEAIGKLTADDGLPDAVASLAQDLRDLGDDCQGSYDNMPEGLQQGDTGQLLEARVQAVNDAADGLEAIDFDDRDEAEADDDYWQRKLDEVEASTPDSE